MSKKRPGEEQPDSAAEPKSKPKIDKFAKEDKEERARVRDLAEHMDAGFEGSVFFAPQEGPGGPVRPDLAIMMSVPKYEDDRDRERAAQGIDDDDLCFEECTDDQKVARAGYFSFHKLSLDLLKRVTQRTEVFEIMAPTFAKPAGAPAEDEEGDSDAEPEPDEYEDIKDIDQAKRVRTIKLTTFFHNNRWVHECKGDGPCQEHADVVQMSKYRRWATIDTVEKPEGSSIPSAKTHPPFDQLLRDIPKECDFLLKATQKLHDDYVKTFPDYDGMSRRVVFMPSKILRLQFKAQAAYAQAKHIRELLAAK